MAMKPSPFTTPFPKMPAVAGVQLAACHSGMRYKNRDDVFLAVFDQGTTVAGVFTQNQCPGEPIKWCREILPHGTARALVVNAGFANVATGKDGYQLTVATAHAAAKLVGAKPEEIDISSTGIIGIPIPREKLLDCLPKLHASLKLDAYEAATKAFGTTDTFPKGVTRQSKIGDKVITINGIIKGSGMIAPNMATTLAYIFTDAAIAASVLQELLDQSVRRTLNCATVDSDTSTSDTCLVFATGAAKNIPITKIDDPKLLQFRADLHAVLEELAKLLVKDGEGIEKFITIKIIGAKSEDSARKIGLAIANSPLVKTALAASDPNWGRFVAAIGKSAEPVNSEKMEIWIGDELVAVNGVQNPQYIEANAKTHLSGREIFLSVDVAIGNAECTVWTCDLTHEYISINADYRS